MRLIHFIYYYVVFIRLKERRAPCNSILTGKDFMISGINFLSPLVKNILLSLFEIGRKKVINI